MRHFVTAIILLIFTNFASGSAAGYADLIAAARSNGPLLLYGGLFLAALLLLCTYAFNRSNAYVALQLLSYAGLELSEFALAYVALGTAWYVVVLEEKLWADVGILIYLPFVCLAVCLQCLCMIDFNFPVNSRIENATLTVLTCILFLLCGQAARLLA